MCASLVWLSWCRNVCAFGVASQLSLLTASSGGDVDDSLWLAGHSAVVVEEAVDKAECPLEVKGPDAART